MQDANEFAKKNFATTYLFKYRNWFFFLLFFLLYMCYRLCF